MWLCPCGPYLIRMTVRSLRHRLMLEELIEWWEDMRDPDISSQVVLMEVPPGWGASTVLKEFKGIIDDPDAPAAISIGIDSVPLVNRAVEAQGLCDALMTPFVRSRLAELLELDTAKGKVQLGLGIGSLFTPGLAVAAPLLLASLAVTAVANAWD